MNDYIKSDLYRYYGNNKFSTFVKAYLINSTFRFQYALRLSNDKNPFFKVLGCFLYYISRTRKYIQIPRQTKIGYGLYIGHGGPIVVNPTCVIVNNVNLSQFTTIGSNSFNAATIGDNTYIGPNVCIIENVIIGDNVTIGAGSIVTKDIPSNATACGNYAKVINYNNPGRFILNKWKIKK